MKRFSSYVFLLISLFLFSSCIREYSPEEPVLELTLGETVTFQVTSDSLAEWQLDGVQIAVGSTFTFYAEEVGTFQLAAVEAPFSAINRVDWTINVTGNVTGQAWYRDIDGDGYGDAGDWIEAAESPEGYVSDHTDCNDDNPDINPGMPEVCDNGLDDDCNGHVDQDDNVCPSEVDPPQNVIASDLTLPYVAISWDPVDGADYYKVYRAAESNGPYELISPDDASLTETHYDFVETWADVEAVLGPYPVKDAAESDEEYQAELDAYVALARDAVTGYKDVGFFIVKAFNAAFESSYSDYDAGQAMLEHTNPDTGGMSEFFEIFKIFWRYPLYKAFANIPDGWAAANWSWSMDDNAGVGNFSAQTQLVNDPALALSLVWDTYTEGRINDAGGKSDRVMTIDGTIYEEIGYAAIYYGSTIEISGLFDMSGNFPGSVDLSAQMDLSSSVNNTSGVAAVTFNGVTYSFPMMLNVDVSLSF